MLSNEIDDEVQRGTEEFLPATTQYVTQLDPSVLSVSISTMAFWTQLMLLLWKNFLYRRRQPVKSSRVGWGWGDPQSPIGRHSPSLFCPADQLLIRVICGRSFSSSSWWPFAIPTPTRAA